MRKLYHYPLCPFSRQIRILLVELGLEFLLKKEDVWIRNPNFLKLNPAGELPVLIELSGNVISDVYAIIEYLHDKYPNFYFLDEDSIINAEIRRILAWFNNKFYREVTKYAIDEKIVKTLTNQGPPKTEFLKAAQINLGYHFGYMTKILELKCYLACDKISVADIAAASHISILDYFGLITWKNYECIKNWYSLIKSRPSFRTILTDRVAGFVPSEYYVLLDF